ncbi:MAG: DNA repair protein RecO [Geminicoccaceae bacterium]
MAIDWQDEGIVLTARAQSENALLLTALTFDHGRHAGWVPGGTGERARALYQPGNRLALTWSARLADHLGRFRAEPLQLLAGQVIDRRLEMTALLAVTQMVDAALGEREPHPTLYAGLLHLIGKLARGDHWQGDFVRFELLLLGELGVALDLDHCAITGRQSNLSFVSPKTGRAVAAGAAPEFEHRLLVLPAFVRDGGEPDGLSFLDGLKLSGWFLQRWVLDALNKTMPVARDRLVQLIDPATSKQGSSSSGEQT